MSTTSATLRCAPIRWTTVRTASTFRRQTRRHTFASGRQMRARRFKRFRVPVIAITLRRNGGRTAFYRSEVKLNHFSLARTRCLPRMRCNYVPKRLPASFHSKQRLIISVQIKARRQSSLDDGLKLLCKAISCRLSHLNGKKSARAFPVELYLRAPNHELPRRARCAQRHWGRPKRRWEIQKQPHETPG